MQKEEEEAHVLPDYIPKIHEGNWPKTMDSIMVYLGSFLGVKNSPFRTSFAPFKCILLTLIRLLKLLTPSTAHFPRRSLPEPPILSMELLSLT